MGSSTQGHLLSCSSCPSLTLPRTPNGKQEEDPRGVPFFLLPFLLFIQSPFLLAFFFSFCFCPLVLSVLLARGWHLFGVSFESLSPRLYVKRYSVVAFGRRVLGVGAFLFTSKMALPLDYVQIMHTEILTHSAHSWVNVPWGGRHVRAMFTSLKLLSFLAHNHT